MDSRRDLLDLIAADPALSTLLEVARARLSGDPGHDVAHALRVALWTVRLAGDDIPPRLAVAAALLHDLVNLPKDSPDRARASELSATEARHLLPEHGFAPEEVDLVADAIRDHSYSRGAVPTSLLGCALQDADRLEALGAIGIMRTISTGARMGAVYFHPDDPWADARPRDDIAFSIDHFFTKLLGLPATMRTEAGRREAERRAATLVDFLHRLGDELGIPPPV